MKSYYLTRNNNEKCKPGVNKWTISWKRRRDHIARDFLQNRVWNEIYRDPISRDQDRTRKIQNLDETTETMNDDDWEEIDSQ